MKETRKAIIELIESFMDKTKSRWVLYKILKDFDYSACWWIIRNKLPNRIKIYKWNYLELSHFNFWEWILFDFKSFEYLEDMQMLLDENIIERIWHYDITAVLKYIEKHSISFPNIIIACDYLNIDFIKNWDKRVWLKCKPLHLYTEEEDKNLLELLQNLWNLN